MNCHEDKKESQRSHSHSPLKHMLHMILCCGLPILVIAILPLISKISPSTAGVIGRIIPFLCPLMMIAMIPMMFGHSKESSCCNKEVDDDGKTKLDNPIK